MSTNSDGFAQFQWEPDPSDAGSTAAVTEAVRPGFVPGRPGEDYRCEAKDADGNTRTVSGELTASGSTAGFTLDPIGSEIVTCALYNSYSYAPRIELSKVNSPTEVRGDLTPPDTVRSTYAVTNPVNTPLADITVTDDKCARVLPVPAAPPNNGFNVGDADTDRLLDLGETWQFTCDRAAQTSGGGVGAVHVVNTATVQGTDPTGTVVTDDASDDVDVFVPGIELTKRVNGQTSVTVPTGSQVTYTYQVENTGNTPLAPVSLVDDTPPCTNPTRGPDDPGNNDGTLDVGETWSYSCTASPTDSVVNTADVTATPLNPLNGNQPFAGRNPNVTDIDVAEVNTVTPGLQLTKSVDANLVFPGTQVRYTYRATNSGTADLRNDTGNPGWVTDNKCASVVPVPATGPNAGDTNADGLLNPGESWQFTCAMPVNALTINIATIVAQPVDANGNPVGATLTRRADAAVRVAQPAIELTKTALRGVVLDPDADPASGPDVPTPRPAEYLYDVSNTGGTPLRNVALTDNRCATITFVGGDTNTDQVLDQDEVWQYTCATALQRQQATPPPGNLSGLVANTATVTGTPFLPDNPSQTAPPVTDSDTAQVLVIEPSLTLTKTASADVVRANGDVTYTVAVTNTGDVGLDLVGPTDDKCPDLNLTGGDTNGNGLLDGADSAAAETWTYTCTRTIGMPPAPATEDTNTASVTGVDPLGNSYLASDPATVRVIDPAIRLVKSVSETLVPAGTQVTYGFDVTNVGTSPVAQDDLLANVTLADVSDPAAPQCARPTLVSKQGGNQDDFLEREPAETWRYTCAATIVAPTTNVAIVGGIGGTQFNLSLAVADLDAAFVQPFHPAIEVSKTADPTTVEPGGEVTYTYEVRNTGDVPLDGVADRITDDTCSPVTYVSGDTDADGLLDTPTSIFEDSADEIWTFTCTTSVEGTTTNVVTTGGTPTDPGGEPLCGQADEANAPGAVSQITAARVAQPCDVTGQDTATVTVAPAETPTSPPEQPPLPFTGSQLPWAVLILGLVLVAGGAVIRIAARRRSRTQ